MADDKMSRPDPFRRGHSDCIQDSCENVPFSSIGGLDSRDNPQKPDWILDEEWVSYLQGYTSTAEEMYGDDWQSCAFSWRPALLIPAKE